MAIGPNRRSRPDYEISVMMSDRKLEVVSSAKVLEIYISYNLSDIQLDINVKKLTPLFFLSAMQPNILILILCACSVMLSFSRISIFVVKFGVHFVIPLRSLPLINVLKNVNLSVRVLILNGLRFLIYM